MIYRFIDKQGAFVVDNPHKYNLYFPLTDKDGRLLSSISPNLAGDIKKDNEHFLNLPASIEDLRSNLLTRRDFFIKTDTEIIRLSRPYQDSLEAGFLYHKLTKRAKFLEIEILNFIPFDTPVEIMQIKVKNKSNKDVQITPTSFIPLYGRGEKNLRDHRHVSSLLNRIYLDAYGIFLKPTMIFNERKHTANEATYFVLGFEQEGRPPIGQFPTLDYFYGDSDLISPDAVYKNVKAVTKKNPNFDGKECCAAFRFKERKLKKREEINYFLIMGIESDEPKIRDIFSKLNSKPKIEKSFEETKKYWLQLSSGLTFDFKDKNFNNWLLWVKLQPTLRKLFGCSFLPHFDYGKGGRGWRDLWQDALTLLLVEPQKAKDFILNNFKGVRIDGTNATIIDRDGKFLSDRNRISRVWMDHGIWPYLTLASYINKTGDLDILLEEDVYFQDHQFRRAKEIDPFFNPDNYILRAKDGMSYSGSILEHILIQNLVQFFNVGRHNIIRLENADWNDGLDMAPDHGESVTFSFMYAHNLKDIITFLSKLKERAKEVDILEELVHLLDAKDNSKDYGDYSYKQKRLDEYLTKVKAVSGRKIKINIADLIYDLTLKSQSLFSWLSQKEWLEEGFFNGYYDNKGRRVEGKAEDGNMRMLLPSQVFAIMSGVATEKQIQKIWLSVKRHLQDEKLGGFRLNTNFNSHHHLDLGRAFGFSYGDKENGAFFSHMVVMFAFALYKRGFAKEASEVINSIYKMSNSSKGKIYPSIPEYFNNEGKGFYLYLTGSSSWYIHTLMDEILGIKFIFGDIHLEPKLLSGNFFAQEIGLSFSLIDKIVKIKFIPLEKTAGTLKAGSGIKPLSACKSRKCNSLTGFIRGKDNPKDKLYKIEEVYLNDKKIHNNIIKKEELTNKENKIEVHLR